MLGSLLLMAMAIDEITWPKEDSKGHGRLAVFIGHQARESALTVVK